MDEKSDKGDHCDTIQVASLNLVTRYPYEMGHREYHQKMSSQCRVLEAEEKEGRERTDESTRGENLESTHTQ